MTDPSVTWSMRLGDAREHMRSLATASIDAVICDPPYPEIDRDYGRMSEPDWHAMMDVVVAEARRVLAPRGSAVFILQANAERVGRMRPWLWEFMAKWCREWGMVQDAYWWNPTALPTVHCDRRRGLMRPSVRVCVWLGPPDCHRDQDEVLWSLSAATKAVDVEDRALRTSPSGAHVRHGRMAATALARGGSTPFNLIPVSNANSVSSAGASGHGAGTPFALCSWWVRYLCPPGGVVLDPFAGDGTIGEAAVVTGRSYVGIESYPDHYRRSVARLDAALPQPVPVPA